MTLNRIEISAIGLALVLLAAGLVYDRLPERPNYSVEQPDRIFESLPVGETHRFTYRVHNRSNKPIRVVGAEFT
jgi:uncharacterized protein (DUF58 family)